MDRLIVTLLNIGVITIITTTLLRGLYIIEGIAIEGFFGLCIKGIFPILFINFLVGKINNKNILDKLFYISVHKHLVSWTGIICITIIGYTIHYMETPAGYLVRLNDLILVPAVAWFLVSSNYHVSKITAKS